VVVQCGLAWGQSAAANHIYDSLPGFAIYTSEKSEIDPEGGNRVLAAGFFNGNGTIDSESLFIDSSALMTDEP
jgi:hypothetical protein